MKVILLQDVKNVGKKDQIVEVSDGYGRNFLIARKLAVMLTDKGLQIRDEKNAAIQNEENRKRDEALKVAEQLKGIDLEFLGKFSGDGRMFGSISPKQIVEQLKDKYNITVDKRKFIDHYAVNAVGFTRLKIELSKGVVGIINVHVSEQK
jgi:large subunit ribosomal protein L9